MRFLLVVLLWVCGQLALSQVQVRGYYRRDGTYVQPHVRSSPDGNPYNNYSYPGNTNPYTGNGSTQNTGSNPLNPMLYSNSTGNTGSSIVLPNYTHVLVAESIEVSDFSLDYSIKRRYVENMNLNQIPEIDFKNLDQSNEYISANFDTVRKRLNAAYSKYLILDSFLVLVTYKKYREDIDTRYELISEALFFGVNSKKYICTSYEIIDETRSIWRRKINKSTQKEENVRYDQLKNLYYLIGDDLDWVVVVPGQSANTINNPAVLVPVSKL